MDFSGCVNDELFGPTVRGCRGDFDFTIVFENVFFSLILFGLGWGFTTNFTTIWLKFWSEDVSTSPAHSSSFYLGIYALLQVSALASLFSVYMVCFRAMISASGARLHKEALRTVINAPLSFFTTTDTGVVTNLFSQDMTLIDGELPQSFLNLILQSFTCLGMAAVIATSSPFLVITYPFLVIIIYGIKKFYLRTSRQIRLLDLEAKSPLYSHFIDTIKGIATYRAFGFILQLVVTALAFVIVTLATQLRSNGGFTSASLVALMTFGNNLSFMIRTYTVLETSIGAISRLKNFSERVKSEGLEGEDIVPPSDWPLRGSIQINGVSASYTDASLEVSKELSGDNDGLTKGPDHITLRNLDITIAPGEKVALCGRTGSGKSSIILLLRRLLNPISSCTERIIIDDIALHKIDRATLRQRIIAVPQDLVFLPDGTSFQTNLDPFDFVDERGGLAAGMFADTLSGGQRQLFNLARAILRRRVRTRQLESELGEKSVMVGGIQLLDEVSSNADWDIDKAMQNIIREEFGGYTIIMVSHRLDMLLGFDKVVVMDKGSIVETGRPSVLVETHGSKFRELWTLANRGQSVENV
ncbi:P-loop containing nucleoside triphosphate hydrolase protein [Daldinia vernicosa]|uniref:P-loop containing nucleoside triphosphate hydrolase protein n=1 Tax=Daldinia vernicosa TaxID=114800 RepID=UPI0020085259|nr:P-loop containing nucleoside triphosphate hydrolase protein [Daldinia vernicosa]KAI0845220.1 P-loop containing nucleoside triphosphate hydrolase protein [Daldinia vernicosa]